MTAYLRPCETFTEADRADLRLLRLESAYASSREHVRVVHDDQQTVTYLLHERIDQAIELRQTMRAIAELVPHAASGLRDAASNHLEHRRAAAIT